MVTLSEYSIPSMRLAIVSADSPSVRSGATVVGAGGTVLGGCSENGFRPTSVPPGDGNGDGYQLL